MSVSWPRAGRRGASSTEYAILVVFVAIALIAVVNTFGYKVQKLWRRDTTAYNTAVTDFRAANPAATPAQLEAAGRAAGRQAVLDGFNNGTVVAGNSIPPLTYPQYYGGAWDGFHPVGGGS